MQTLDITYPCIDNVCLNSYMLHGELMSPSTQLWKYFTQVLQEYNLLYTDKKINRSFFVRAYQWHIKNNLHILQDFISYIKIHLQLNIISHDTKNNTENIITWSDISNTDQDKDESMQKLSNTIVSYINMLEANCKKAEKKMKAPAQKPSICKTQLTKYIEEKIKNITPHTLIDIFEPAILSKRNVIADGKDPGIRSLQDNTNKQQVISWIATFFTAPHHKNYSNIEKDLYAIVYKKEPLTDFWKQKFIIYIMRYLEGTAKISPSAVQERLEQNDIQLPSKI